MVNLTADLRDEFSWNTKQIFLYVQLDFETSRSDVNQAVMWSEILPSRVSEGED